MIGASALGFRLWAKSASSGLVAGILVIVIATAYGQIVPQSLEQAIFDALSRRDLHAFLVAARHIPF